MAFSEEEFGIMIDELLSDEPVSFDMLCRIAENTLRKKVEYWCSAEECLRGRGYADDIMQEIQLRLMNTTITHFLLKDGVNGPVNMDPKGFRSWMFKVAENIKRDFASKVRGADYYTENIDDPLTAARLSVVANDMDDEGRELLKEAFSTVLSADMSIYKILTWLAQFIFVIELDITKIRSNDEIVKAFGQKTLYEMYAMLLRESRRVPWIEISPRQNERILSSLARPWKNGVSYGDVRYKEFFMKVNGRSSGKKSISDWVNRLNNMIRRKVVLTDGEG